MEISTFREEYSFLSNFYFSPFFYKEKEWPTVEHIFQASKAMDKKDREKIRLAFSPGQAKRLGRKVDLRPNWEKIKYRTMLGAVRLKFGQNKKLRNKLKATGKTPLVEGNTWHDNVWGNCSCPKCEDIMGNNLLGKILMQIRDGLE